LVDAFVGGEAPLTFHALAAAANRLALFALARVDHFVIQESAKGALHCKLRKSWVIPDCSRSRLRTRLRLSRSRSTIPRMRKRGFRFSFFLLAGDSKPAQRDMFTVREDESYRNHRHECDQPQHHAATHCEFRRVTVAEVWLSTAIVANC